MKQIPLSNFHRDNGGKMVEFAGFDMPVWFSNIKDEHLAVRHAAGIFDISHMGVLKLTGDNLLEDVQRLTCNSVEKALNATMTYSMILNESGGVLDDVMFGFIGDVCHLVVNASNKQKIMAWMAEKTPGIHVDDMTEYSVFFAIQGPKAVATLSEVLNVNFEANKRFSITQQNLGGYDVLALRSGYTGEDGYEFVVPQEYAQELWLKLLEAGVTPCGLAARDSLRLEKGLPLYGQEFDETVTPLMTRYSWVLKWDKPFIGKEALEAQKGTDHLVTVGLEILGKGIPRGGYPIKEGGRVTSGTMSPSLGKAIAMALVKPEFKAIGSEVTIDVRGRDCVARVTAVPFL
jgi:aminomethyltransferase